MRDTGTYSRIAMQFNEPTERPPGSWFFGSTMSAHRATESCFSEDVQVKPYLDN